MSPAGRRSALVEVAADTQTDLEARFFAGAADILAHYHVHVGPLRQLVAAGNDDLGKVVAAIAEDGTLVVGAPVDYLIWQPGMGGGGPLSRYEKRQLRTTGRVSPRAERELSARGWTVVTEVDLDE